MGSWRPADERMRGGVRLGRRTGATAGSRTGPGGRPAATVR